MKYEPKLEKVFMCPIEYGLNAFGGKWKARIICILSAQETTRYNKIRRSLTSITDTVLASTLKELLEDGIINRKQYNEIPPRVEYSLTENGRSILPVLQSVCQWSREQTSDGVNKDLPVCQDCSHNCVD